MKYPIIHDDLRIDEVDVDENNSYLSDYLQMILQTDYGFTQKMYKKHPIGFNLDRKRRLHLIIFISKDLYKNEIEANRMTKLTNFVNAHQPWFFSYAQRVDGVSKPL